MYSIPYYDISEQVCAMKVLAIAVGKGHDSLIYIYEEYNSVSKDSTPPFRTQYLLRMQLQHQPYEMLLGLQQWLEKATDNTLF